VNSDAGSTVIGSKDVDFFLNLICSIFKMKSAKTMIKTRELELLGTNAVKKLRVSKLRDGNPFMINIKTLPSNQAYLEYPNGKVILVTYSSKSRDFVVLRELSNEESSSLRVQLDLESVSI
jgi:hypothetical protein